MISRFEQISPVPYTDVVASLEKYSNAEVMYVQEEPLNGAPTCHSVLSFERKR